MGSNYGGAGTSDPPSRQETTGKAQMDGHGQSSQFLPSNAEEIDVSFVNQTLDLDQSAAKHMMIGRDGMTLEEGQDDEYEEEYERNS